MVTDISEIVEGIKSKSLVVEVINAKELCRKFGSDDFCLLHSGQISLVDFLSLLTPDSPVKIIRAYEGRYLVVDKEMSLHPFLFVDNRIIKSFFSSENKEILLSTFIEISSNISSIFDEVSKSSCTSCSMSSKFHSLLQLIFTLDNSNRDMDSLGKIFGEDFVTALRKFPVVKQNNSKDIPTPKEIPVESSGIGESGPRPSCIQCCMKHIGTAIVLLEEASNGYPSHRWIAVGELNEAANEIVRDFPEVAAEIRDMRHSVSSETKKFPNLITLLDKLDKKFFR